VKKLDQELLKIQESIERAKRVRDL
jgi:hypothetical protein